jgi:hypothetical protein
MYDGLEGFCKIVFQYIVLKLTILKLFYISFCVILLEFLYL